MAGDAPRSHDKLYNILKNHVSTAPGPRPEPPRNSQSLHEAELEEELDVELAVEAEVELEVKHADVHQELEALSPD